MKKHDKMHGNKEVRFSCDHCAGIFVTKSGLKKHQQSNHQNMAIDRTEPCDAKVHSEGKTGTGQQDSLSPTGGRTFACFQFA